MKHGVAFRTLSRTTSHRILMLRNMVTSLFEHEQIKTTLPKARETARFAEKIITLGKRGDKAAYDRAAALLLNPELLPKLFGTFAKRYAQRPGGYTRIHKFGNRPGDNAPHAVLELVDNPRDIRWEITSRAVGWDLLREKLKSKRAVSIINAGAKDALEVISEERGLSFGETGRLRPMTRWNLQKVLKFRDQSAPLLMSQKAGDYMDHLLATPVVFREIEEEERAAVAEHQKAYNENKAKPPSERDQTLKDPPKPLRRALRPAGHALPGETRGALHLARGALSDRKPQPRPKVLTPGSLFSRQRQPRTNA
ncbi:mitochondrial ribosomal protein L17 [Mycena rosella]|uniref:Mitochondrial ribosomal protein L17 n=1 Tax=Mycena rosella TaxID=1033263 RepID=A0AAD7M8U1_MYCRO|nr:mitochondrial ribosomal protein L17 [Mycena rosella]